MMRSVEDDALREAKPLVDDGSNRTVMRVRSWISRIARRQRDTLLHMGLTYLEGTLRGPTGKTRVSRFLVDSGASYTLLAEQDWRFLEVAPKRTMQFTLADGTMVTRQIGECHIALPQGEGHTPVILGEPGDEPLLGAVTLEILGLVLNPFSRELQPMRAMLATAPVARTIETEPG